ncbi:golgi family transporter [Strigomonas culicis]|uniref:Golgi family transporter n=1 Tax=Strigomonas culicis TaxID=28005 RepID=S9VT82_9TRYP|nr:golgi family transporter [Strigomonas culicis]EPY30346.1 golgi family transporter [Strigomonas culicis]|eukprot:EPY27316.1 golgi family transporter [Strigomonas culicis]
MDSLYNWNDFTKIGVALTGLGVLFSFLGIVMLLDRALLTIGNVLFVVGVALVVGPKRFKTFFVTRRRASICFFLGILLVLFGWCIFGLVIEGFGILNLFGDFFPVVARVLESTPLIGPIILSRPVQQMLRVVHLQNPSSNRNV